MQSARTQPAGPQDPAVADARRDPIARLRGLAWALRNRYNRRRLAGYRLLRAFAKARPEAFFIQIGANDGQQSDHLQELIRSRRSRWRGILVEPQPEAFRRLSDAYAGNRRLTLERVAISDRDGRLPFYEIEPPASGDPELFGSYDLLGSLDREALLDHDWIAGVEERIVRTEVDCLSLVSLCRKHGVERLDLLAVDTEGHDHAIVKQIDDEVPRPSLLVYEHLMLTSRSRRECRSLLRERGYELMEEFLDTWCLDPEADGDVTRVWRRLTPAGPAMYIRD